MNKIGIKFDGHKLKWFTDLSFVLIENFVIKLDKTIPFYLDFYKSMIENEIKLAGISKNDIILHIGCGLVPATPIHIIKKTDGEVTTIDKNLKSIKKAQELLLKLRLSDKIRIIHSDALNFPLEKFNLIIVSLGVKPHHEILKYISQNMRSNAQVIFRSNSYNGKSLSENDHFLKHLFDIKDIVFQKQNGTLVSILLVKKSK